MHQTTKIIALHAMNTPASPVKSIENLLKIENSSDVMTLASEVASADAIELHFPAFTDGRAFSQAIQLRKRLGFQGDVRATGDVLIDQLAQMQRCGFSSAALREDQSAEHAERLLTHYSAFYQVDVAKQPAFMMGELA